MPHNLKLLKQKKTAVNIFVLNSPVGDSYMYLLLHLQNQFLMITLFFRIKHVMISVPKYVFHCLQFFSLYNKGRIEQDLDSHTVNILKYL